MQVRTIRTQAFAEDPVGPALVGQHKRQKDRCHDSDHFQGVGAGRGIINCKIVSWIQGGDHQIREQSGKDHHRCQDDHQTAADEG